MSGIAVTGLNKFSFPLDPTMATGAVQIDAVPNPALLAALVNPQGVLPAQDTLIAGADLSVAPGQTIAVGPAQVGFSADVNAAIGIFTTPGTLRAALMKGDDVVSQVGDALTFAPPAGGDLLLLRWGYDISGTAAGTVALAPATSFTLSADAGRKGYYAIVQGAAAGANALKALGRLIATWKLPSQVRDIGQLPPATWLIAEVDGSFGIKADLKFGYSFSWVREVAGLGLTGDIGLKLQAGLDAVFGFSTSGKYALALGRESADEADQKIRLRLYKLRVNGWNFGFGGTPTITAVMPGPAQFADVASAIVGITGQQIMKMLGSVKDWTDPSQPLFGPFVNMVDSEARALIQTIGGVSDLNVSFLEVKDAIQKAFQFWDKLPQTATNLIWQMLPDRDQIAKVATVARQVAGMTPESLLAFVQSSLGNVPFLGSTEGQALESWAANGLFAALNDAGALSAIGTAAQEVSQLLDGGALQALLTNLQAQVNTRLDLKQIETVVDQSTLESVDTWLKARLEDFLEQKIAGPAGVAELQKLRAGLGAVLANQNELYSKALNALLQNHDLSFNAAYQSTPTTSALLDVTFDFGAPGTHAAAGLELALAGKFDELLAAPLAGVAIQEGVLAYGIHTQSHVSLALPFFSAGSGDITNSLAKLSHVQQDGGGLVYSLEASDLATLKNDFSSALAISLSVPGGLPNVRIHSTDSATYRYDMKTTVSKLTSADLVSRYGPYMSAYFPTEFQQASPGTFADWVRQIAGSAGELDNAQVALSVSLPPSAMLAWLNAPANAADPIYQLMATKLQARFKQLLADYFFADVRNYANVSGDTAAKAVLAFCSIPLFADAGYWDYRDPEVRSNMLSEAVTQGNLRNLLQTARVRIAAAGDPDRVLEFYQDDQLGAILGSAINGQFIDFLFPVEANMVGEARTAGMKMASFRQDQFANPAQARTDLAQFGQKLTQDFNNNLKTFAVGDALLPLGTMVYTEAVAALDPAAAAPAAAMFSVQAGGRSERVVHGK